MPNKLQQLKEIIAGLGSAVLAYSGGVDSTFLLKVAHDVLPQKILPVIATSLSYPPAEVKAAQDFCQSLGVQFMTIKTDEFSDPTFIQNTPDRCYHCKRELFAKLLEIARQRNLWKVVDGSNQDDKTDFRPGSRAKTEMGVRSPLQEAGITKAEIRAWSKEMGLPTWDKPSMACLASRIPYGTALSQALLQKVLAGEEYLKTLGFKQLRVRHHGPVARIEIEKELMGAIMCDGVMDKITRYFEKLGYTYVTLDLKGFRSGSMNETLSESAR